MTKIPKYKSFSLKTKKNDVCLIIPIINEGSRIITQLKKIKLLEKKFDIVICDGGSTDGSTDLNVLNELNVTTLLVKEDYGKLSTQLLIGFDWAIKNGYLYFVTIDGNNKDSVEDIPQFISKLEEGYDFIQGSRFIKGGKAVNTPILRLLALRLIHAPVISFSSNYHYTDTTNGFRGYSLLYLTHPKVDLFRSVFKTYELLVYLSVRASQLGLKVTEIPVKREYPKNVKVPTKISPIKGNFLLLKVLFLNLFKSYHPK
jgi:dolichol-phosphate mannosyltransferase